MEPTVNRNVPWFLNTFINCTKLSFHLLHLDQYKIMKLENKYYSAKIKIWKVFLKSLPTQEISSGLIRSMILN